VSYKDAVVLDSINEGEKISILSDSMLKTMFQNENRIKYSAKFISYFLDVSYEELLKNIHLSKNELDKKVDNDKGEKCDYVALIDNTSINIEVNNNGSIGVLERNMEYDKAYINQEYPGWKAILIWFKKAALFLPRRIAIIIWYCCF
jgi:hypothetical protein